MTDQTPRFCASCGTALVEGAGFCGACGAPLAAAQAPPTPVTVPSTPTGERVVTVIPNASIKGGFMGMKSTTYTLVLTDSRIVFAELTAAMMKQVVASARDSAKADGKGFLGQWGAQMGAYSDMASAYLTKAPETTLAENPGNFFIGYSDVEKAKLHKGAERDEDSTPKPDRLVIKTSSQKYSLELGGGMGQAKSALREVGLV